MVRLSGLKVTGGRVAVPGSWQVLAMGLGEQRVLLLSVPQSVPSLTFGSPDCPVN